MTKIYLKNDPIGDARLERMHQAFPIANLTRQDLEDQGYMGDIVTDARARGENGRSCNAALLG